MTRNRRVSKKELVSLKGKKKDRPPSPRPLPVVPATKITEERSRLRLKEVFSPWLVTDIQHDYGIDGLVEITRPHSSDANFDPTGKRFAFQLKASNRLGNPPELVEVRVRPEHIRYWLENTEPVLLVFCHVPSGRLFWRWIDDGLIQELSRRNSSWTINETVPVSVPEINLEKTFATEELERFVRSYKGSSSRLLAPGIYVKLQKEVSQIAQTMLEKIRNTEFKSVITRLESLHQALLSNTYMVAIAGPARAGKSTLMNTLLGIQVSPIGQLPTTAVTLMVVGSDKNEAEIFFENGEKAIGPSSAEFVKQFATQEENPENHKKVKCIVIHLINEILERGISYIDAPGLYDPSETIREITAKALNSAHAILYILDVSPMANGGFYLSEHHIKDLTRLSENQKHLFLVLNKADVLDADLKRRAGVYIEDTLKKYNLWDKLAYGPVFLSALESWKWKEAGGKGDAPQKPLDDALWDFLLRTNNTGINRLLQSASELKRACGDLATLVNARRLNGTQALELRQSLEKCRQRQFELIISIRGHVSQEIEAVKRELPLGRQLVIEQLKQWLSKIPFKQELPNSKDIQSNVSKWLFGSCSQIWTDLEARSKNFAAHISIEVEKTLNQTRLAGGLTQNMRILLPPVPVLDLSKTETFEEAWAGLVLGALGFFGGGPLGIVLTIGGWIGGLLLGREARRKRQIQKIVKGINHSMDGIYQNLQLQIEEKIGLYGKSLEDQANDRMGVFVADAEKQLSKLGQSISPDEQKEMVSIEQEIKTVVPSLDEVEKQLNPTGLPS